MTVTVSSQRALVADAGRAQHAVAFPAACLLSLLLSTSLLGVLAAGCSHRQEDSGATAETREIPVRTALVRDTLLAPSVRASGLLGAKEEIPLGFKTGGVIARVDADEGDVVRQGELLATLEMAEIDALVAKAEAAAEQADRSLARARALFADSVVTREQLELAETGHRVAAGDLEAARFNRKYAEIRSPAAGTVLRRLADPGQLIGPGSPVFLLGAGRQGQVVRIGLADQDASRVSIGDPVEIRFDAHPGELWAGRVTELGAAAAPGVGTYEIEISLDRPVSLNAGGGAVSGLVGHCVIHPSRARPLRLIPIEALLEADGASGYAWAVTATATATPGVRRARVEVLALLDRWAAVNGLDGVERVVTEGAAYLTASARVGFLDGAGWVGRPSAGAGADSTREETDAARATPSRLRGRAGGSGPSF